MQFPKDHHPHTNIPIEWYYFWGMTPDKKFFHHTRLWSKLGSLEISLSQFSLHNWKSIYWDEIDKDGEPLKSVVGYMPDVERDRFYFSNPVFSAIMFPQSKPVVHPVGVGRNYYSIPLLEGTLLIKGDDKKIPITGWFDHEFSEMPLNPKEVWGWDWVTVHMDCGMQIVGFKGKRDNFCSVICDGRVIPSDFILDGKHFFVNQTGMYLTLEPLVQEVIREPQSGGRYSEQPFKVVLKSGIIGWGLRERTYGGEDG